MRQLINDLASRTLIFQTKPHPRHFNRYLTIVRQVVVRRIWFSAMLDGINLKLAPGLTAELPSNLSFFFK